MILCGKCSYDVFGLQFATCLRSLFCVVEIFLKVFAFHSEYSLFLILPLVSPSFHLVSVVSPLEVAEFARELIELPDQEAVSYVHNGLQHSFSVGVPA